MTRVDFYTFADDRLEVARRLAVKAWSRGLKVMLYAPDAPVAEAIDRMLWTTPALGFVPHCRDRDALVRETPVVIGTDVDMLDRHDVLINLHYEWPPAFARFERVLEIVGTEDADREAGRARYRFYQARGYELSSNDVRDSSRRSA